MLQGLSVTIQVTKVMLSHGWVIQLGDLIISGQCSTTEHQNQVILLELKPCFMLSKVSLTDNTDVWYDRSVAIIHHTSCVMYYYQLDTADNQASQVWQ